ncbi:hypothetical protein Bpfe_015554 [Biomphalaria pfeifferi]|uniref:FHA domain-containing protein n=1 Tax=Biomphalaria pfeifferi TaxID=112525 RepID=A0AAD8F8W5_BIOPF|nr:hypothetical protein Bpfe_015554 [Biomphalaria pfeifferi]
MKDSICNVSPRLTCSLPDLNKNLKIILCTKCKALLNPSSASVMNSSRSLSSNPLTYVLGNLCAEIPCCPDFTNTESSTQQQRFILETSKNLIKIGTWPHSVGDQPDPTPHAVVKTGSSTSHELNLVSWKILADQTYLMVDSDTSGIMVNDSVSIDQKASLPGVKKFVSFDFNIVHIDPEEKVTEKFLMYKNNARSDSNNNLKHAQVFYMPLKMYGIRDSTADNPSSEKCSIYQPARCPSSLCLSDNLPSVSGFEQKPTTYQVSPEKSVQCFNKNLPTTAKFCTKDQAGCKAAQLPATNAPILRKSEQKSSLESKLTKLQRISFKFMH